jgi:hypothetical protein
MTKIIRSSENHLDNLQGPEVGSVYFDDHYDYFIRIDKIIEERPWKDDQSHVVYYAKTSKTEDGITWEKGSRIELGEFEPDPSFRSTHYVKLNIERGETVAQAIESIHKDFISALLNPTPVEDDDEESTSKALIPAAGKERYEAAAAAIIKAKTRAEIITRLAKTRMDEIERVARDLQKKLSKIMRVLTILEVYLGVNEEVFQLTAGQASPPSEPISIRQLVLNMDEEAAIVDVYKHRDGYSVHGLNWEDVNTFDQWLLDGDNLNQVLPEAKGIVALRPSNQRDSYRDLDPLEAAQNKENDRMIYLLIRNGENLYRVWTNTKMSETLFPTMDVSAKIEEMFQDDWNKEEAEISHSVWVRNALLIQGLIDRTQILQPISVDRIELTKPETFEDGGPVRLIRDAEKIITDGHEPFHNWKKRINEMTTRGSRIYLLGIPWDKDGNADRFTGYRRWAPELPDSGVYTVHEIRKSTYSGNIVIQYLPGDEIYHRGGYTRKNGKYQYEESGSQPRKRQVGIRLYNDEFINYDEFTVEDADYFLTSRLERPYYKNLIPVLSGLRQSRIEELEEEKAFVKLLAVKHNLTEKKLFDLVNWWKNKVINHRPLSKDDAKAWRMIIAKATHTRIVKPK